MARAKASKIVQVKARMREPLRARLEAVAKGRGVSINSELVERLERSFAKDDAFGGLAIANMARLMAAAFLQGGQHEAHARQRTNSRPADWIHNSECYDAAVKAVVRALKSMRPINFPPEGPVTLYDLREHYGLIDLDQDGDPMQEDSKTEQRPLVQEPKEEPSDER